MKTLLVVIVIALIGVGTYWYMTQSRNGQETGRVEEELSHGAERMREAFREGMEKFSLRSEEIREELAKSGTVIRRKAREVGGSIADATADARVTGTIKSKLLADPDLSALRISVDTTAGVVTLSGSVSSHEEIGKAMLLALNTAGVTEVISTLQVRRKRESGEKENSVDQGRDTNALPAK